MTGEASPSFAEVLERSSVIISAGSGGVGKTTTAAAIALAGARTGRRVVVVTIDPARRLADALGLEGIGNDAQRIEGPWPGELWAAMLDTRATFDALVRDQAPPDQAEHILANRFYRNIADSLSGTQEYMAAEKLHALHRDGRFDLVVVDTPPTRNALDFIEAPHTLTRFLDHRLYRLLMTPTRRMSRAVGVATTAFVRTVSRVAGAAVVEDAIEFFRAFEGLEDGFRRRAAEVSALFRDDRTGFVLVTSPRRDALEEADWFARQLRAGDMEVRALVANRVQPRPLDGSTEPMRALAAAHPGSALAVLCVNLAEQCEMADHERAMLAGLVDDVGDAPVVLVPILGSDVHDLEGLTEIAERLVS